MKRTGEALQRVPAALVLALSGLLLFGLHIGMPLTDGDTAFYARIARNIVESGDWQTLRFKDYALIDKPPLTMWLIAVSYYFFGVNEAAIRCWHVLMAIGIVLILFKTALLFYSQSTALLSAWMLLSSALFGYMAMVPQQDVPLTFFLALGLYGFARVLRGDGWQHMYLFWIATALGVLARGLQSFVLAVVIAGATLFLLGWEHRRRLLTPWPRTALHVAAGLLVCLLIAAPWFVLEYRVHGRIFFDTFFGAGNSRFFESGSDGFDPVRFFSYVPLLLVAFLPWSGLSFHALVDCARNVLRPSPAGASAGTGDSGLARMGDTLFFVWFLVAYTMPWVISWRVIRYLLPAIPPLAVIAARYLTPFVEGVAGRDKASGGMRLAALLGVIVVLPTLLLTIAVLANALPPEQLIYVPMVLPLLLALAASMLFFAWAGWTRRYRLAVSGLVAGGLLSTAFLLSGLNAFMVDINPWKEAAAVVNKGAGPDERVVWAGGGDNWFLDFYVDGWVNRAEAVEADPAAFAGSWWVGTQAQIERLSVAAGLDVEPLWNRGEIVVVRAR